MAIDVQTPAVESSPAANTSVPTAPVDLSSFSRAERQTWRDTGKLPGDKPAEEASATSEEIDNASSDADGDKAAAETAPASEAGKETQGKPRTERDKRITDLLVKVKKLESEAEARKGTTEKKAVESSPAVAEPAKALEVPKKPNAKDFEGKPYEEFEAAYDKYVQDLAEYSGKKAVQDFQTQQTQQQELKKLNDQISEASTRYGKDVNEVIKPTVATLLGDKALPQAPIQMINSSPVFVDLMYVLGEDPKALADFIATAKSDPALAIRKVIAMENGIMAELSKGKESKGKEPAASAEAENIPQRDSKTGKFLSEKSPESTTARVPKPVSEVGGRGTTSEDALKSAANANDMRTFKREATRRYMDKAKNG